MEQIALSLFFLRKTDGSGIPKRIPDKDLNILTQLYFNNFLSLSQKYQLAVTIPYGLVFWGFFYSYFVQFLKLLFIFCIL